MYKHNVLLIPRTSLEAGGLSASPGFIARLAAGGKDNRRDRHSAKVWLASVLSLLVAMVLTATGNVNLLRIEIPLGAVLTAMAMVSSRPVAYFHFTLWSWFITPLIRRLVDWRFGFENQNLVLATPVLVSSVALVTLLQHRRSPTARGLAPFGLCTAGILYGLVVGLIRFALHAPGAASLAEIIYELLNWIAPLLFGLHLYLRWPDFQRNKLSLHRSFIWATLFLSAYGLYQYIFSPAWDAFWLRAMIEGGSESFGLPEPFQMRIWSTSNSPAPFANILMFGLLVVFFLRSRLKLFVTAFGYAAFLLTLVRTAWLGWLVGLIFMCRGTNKRQIVRVLGSLVLIPIMLSPLLFIPEAAEAVRERVQTFSGIKQDVSLLDRERMYKVLFAEAQRQPFGSGLSNQYLVDSLPVDSGFLQIWFILGPLGCFLYFAGIWTALGTGGSKCSSNRDHILFHAIALGILVQFIGALVTVGVSGALLWVAISYAAAARQEHLQITG